MHKIICVLIVGFLLFTGCDIPVLGGADPSPPVNPPSPVCDVWIDVQDGIVRADSAVIIRYYEYTAPCLDKVLFFACIWY